MGAVAVYLNLTATAFTEDAVDQIFTAYLSRGWGKARRFYLHTSDSAMRGVYDDVNAATGKKYITMPEV
jgi:phosphoribulokinase